MAKKKAPTALAGDEGADDEVIIDDDTKSRWSRQSDTSDKTEDLVADEDGVIGDWDLPSPDDEDAPKKLIDSLTKLKAAQLSNDKEAMKARFKAWGRRAVWTGILYPEMRAAVEKANGGMDWVEVAEGLHAPMLLSPEHNDMARVKGKLVKKKKHWHVIYYVPGGKFSYDQMRAILGDELGLVMIEPVLAQGALVRYFCHLDCAPFDVSGKHKYPTSELVSISGYDPDPYLYWRTDDQIKGVWGIQQFAIDHGIYQYSELVDELRNVDRPDWNYLMYLPNTRNAVRDYMTNRWHSYDAGTAPTLVQQVDQLALTVIRQQQEIDALKAHMQVGTP